MDRRERIYCVKVAMEKQMSVDVNEDDVLVEPRGIEAGTEISCWEGNRKQIGYSERWKVFNVSL